MHHPTYVSFRKWLLRKILKQAPELLVRQQLLPSHFYIVAEVVRTLIEPHYSSIQPGVPYPLFLHRDCQIVFISQLHFHTTQFHCRNFNLHCHIGKFRLIIDAEADQAYTGAFVPRPVTSYIQFPYSEGPVSESEYLRLRYLPLFYRLQ